MVGITNLLNAAFNAVLVPVWARESGSGPAAIGLTGSVAGATAVAGSLIAAMAAHRLRRRTVFFAGFLLAGAPKFLVLALDAPLGTVLAVFAVSGFGAGFLNPVIGAVVFERVPRRMLGRVNALGDSLAWSGIPLGGLIAGAAVASVGLTPVLLACGAAYFLTTNLAALRPEWRTMDGRGARDEPEPLRPSAPAGGEETGAAGRAQPPDAAEEHGHRRAGCPGDASAGPAPAGLRWSARGGRGCGTGTWWARRQARSRPSSGLQPVSCPLTAMRSSISPPTTRFPPSITPVYRPDETRRSTVL